MAKYSVGDKVITTDEWDNGMGKIIPKGSVVEIFSTGGSIGRVKYYRCKINNEFLFYAENMLGEKIRTNADRIRSMSDEELAEWLTKVTDDAQLDAETKCNYQWKDWLQSEVEE